MSYKRKLKRLVNPFYGKKGMGWIKNPKRAFKSKMRRDTKKAVNGAMGCLWACIWYPCYWTAILIYWMFVLMWWMIKYLFVGMWWLAVKIINGAITIIETIININKAEITDAQIEEVTTEESSAEK